VLEDAARARGAEANVLAKSGHMCGAVYLAGYVVECRLKTLLNKMGRPFPTSGREGHNLIGLWDSAGLSASAHSGFRRAFLEYWNTKMRYSSTIESPHSPEDLLRGAQELAGFVSSRIAHTRGIRRRRS
jgi:hypothetical protein